MQSKRTGGGKTFSEPYREEAFSIVTHPRTMRKARMNIKSMVETGVSHRKIRNYLHRFAIWRATTSKLWTYEELLKSFIKYCWDSRLATFAASLLVQHAKVLCNGSDALSLSESIA